MLNDVGRIKFQTNDFTGALAILTLTLLISDVLSWVLVTSMWQSHISIWPKLISILDMTEIEAIGEDHEDVTNVLMTIGESYRDTGYIERASYFMNRAVHSCISAFGQIHESLSFLYHELGQLALTANDHGRATVFFEAGLDVERKLEGPDKDNRIAVSLALPDWQEKHSVGLL
eukprot:scaffold1802_cov162-Chaetoceros_neogracile.AAC.5